MDGSDAEPTHAPSRSLVARLRDRARLLRTDVTALWLASRDPRVPLVAKVLAVFVVAYALSPIDLIPDFVPVLGYLDDLILVPAGIALAIRLIPPAVLQEHREVARATPETSGRHRWLGAALVLGAWVAALVAFATLV